VQDVVGLSVSILRRVRHVLCIILSRYVCSAPLQTKSDRRRLCWKPPAALSLIPSKRESGLSSLILEDKFLLSPFSYSPRPKTFMEKK